MAIDLDIIDVSLPTGSANGEPIDVNVYNTVHTVPSGTTQEVFLSINNPNAVDIDAFIRFGTTGSNIMTVKVPAKTSRLVLNGLRVSGGSPSSVIQVQAPGCRAFSSVNHIAGQITNPPPPPPPHPVDTAQGDLIEWLTDYTSNLNTNFVSIPYYSSYNVGSPNSWHLHRIDNERFLHIYRNVSNTWNAVVGTVDTLGNITAGTPVTFETNVDFSGFAGVTAGLAANEFIIWRGSSATQEVRAYSMLLGSGNTITSINLVETFAPGTIGGSGSGSAENTRIIDHGAGRYVASHGESNGSGSQLRLTYLQYDGSNINVIQTISHTGNASATYFHDIVVEDFNAGYFFGYIQASGAPDNSWKAYKYTLTPTNIVPGNNVPVDFIGTPTANYSFTRIRNNLVQAKFHGSPAETVWYDFQRERSFILQTTANSAAPAPVPCQARKSKGSYLRMAKDVGGIEFFFGQSPASGPLTRYEPSVSMSLGTDIALPAGQFIAWVRREDAVYFPPPTSPTTTGLAGSPTPDASAIFLNEDTILVAAAQGSSVVLGLIRK